MKEGRRVINSRKIVKTYMECEMKPNNERKEMKVCEKGKNKLSDSVKV